MSRGFIPGDRKSSAEIPPQRVEFLDAGISKQQDRIIRHKTSPAIDGPQLVATLWTDDWFQLTIVHAHAPDAFRVREPIEIDISPVVRPVWISDVKSNQLRPRAG